MVQECLGKKEKIISKHRRDCFWLQERDFKNVRASELRNLGPLPVFLASFWPAPTSPFQHTSHTPTWSISITTPLDTHPTNLSRVSSRSLQPPSQQSRRPGEPRGVLKREFEEFEVVRCHQKTSPD